MRWLRRRPDPALAEIQTLLWEILNRLPAPEPTVGELQEVLDLLPAPEPTAIETPLARGLFTRGALTSKGIHSSREIATDASVGRDAEAVAWVGDNGAWGLSVRNSGGAPNIVTAELRAIQYALGTQQAALACTIYTDNRFSAQLCQFWLGMSAESPCRPTVLQAYRDAVPRLCRELMERNGTQVHWVARDTHPLNKAAHRIAALGTDQQMRTAEQVRAIAGSIAGNWARIHRDQVKAGVVWLPSTAAEAAEEA